MSTGDRTNWYHVSLGCFAAAVFATTVAWGAAPPAQAPSVPFPKTLWEHLRASYHSHTYLSTLTSVARLLAVKDLGPRTAEEHKAAVEYLLDVRDDAITEWLLVEQPGWVLDVLTGDRKPTREHILPIALACIALSSEHGQLTPDDTEDGGVMAYVGQLCGLLCQAAGADSQRPTQSRKGLYQRGEVRQWCVALLEHRIRREKSKQRQAWYRYCIETIIERSSPPATPVAPKSPVKASP